MLTIILLLKERNVSGYVQSNKGGRRKRRLIEGKAKCHLKMTCIRIRKTTPRIGESGSQQDCLECLFFSNLQIILL
jgi:hypothetical protein